MDGVRRYMSKISKILWTFCMEGKGEDQLLVPGGWDGRWDGRCDGGRDADDKINNTVNRTNHR